MPYRAPAAAPNQTAADGITQGNFMSTRFVTDAVAPAAFVRFGATASTALPRALVSAEPK
jgi:hypothetical protein